MRVRLESSPTLDHFAIQLSAGDLDSLTPARRGIWVSPSHGNSEYAAVSYLVATVDAPRGWIEVSRARHKPFPMLARLAHVPQDLMEVVNAVHPTLKRLFEHVGATCQPGPRWQSVDLYLDSEAVDHLRQVGKYELKLGGLEFRYEAEAHAVSETSEWRIAA